VRTGVSDDLTEVINQIFHRTQLNNGQIDSKRYRGSYAFAEESLLPGATSLILSAAFDDLESLGELFATADPL
jgi:hypothetical protein